MTTQPSLLSRIPWTPVVITLLVILTSGMAVQPVREAATLADVAEAHLMRSMGYIALAPLSAVLDTLTLLSVAQHIALFVGIVILFVVGRVIAARTSGVTVRQHLVATALLIGGLALTYVAVLALPRPMAALVAANANVMIVDFHSHTGASHDGRSGWTAENNRAWHRDAGFNVAFIADHGVFTEAEKGIAGNPNPAGDGVTLLQSVEVAWNGEHIGILGAERAYKGLLTNNNRDVDEQALRLASFITGREPVVIWHHPKELNRLPLGSAQSPAGVRAIEIVGGSPSRLGGVRAQRVAIASQAQTRNYPLVTGSDNHGWGRATPGWTVMNIPDWRSLNGDQLALLIERVLRESGYRGTRAIERRVADPGDNKLLLALSVFTVPLRMLTTISIEERVAWLLWAWALWLLVRWRRRSTARAA